MRRMKRALPSPAMVVALVALITALGGTAYAAFLPKNSVGTNQIKPKAVKTADIGSQQVGANQIKNDAVNENKLADGTVGAAKLKAAAVGTEQLAEAAVTTGKLADRSVKLGKLGITVVTHFADSALPDDGTVGIARAQCAAGEVIVSGGASFNIPDSAPPGTTLGDDIQLLSSRPSILPEAPSGFPTDGSGFNAWRVSARNPNIGTGNTPAIEVTSQAVCLKDTTP